MLSNIRLRLLSYLVIVYLLVAFTWWSILLFTKNRDAFQAKANYMELVMVAEGGVANHNEFEHTTAYQELKAKYERQEWMILGEACVFVVSLVIGVYLINRGYNKEMMAAQQRRNFLLSITHELKSPLASIQLVLQTFLKRTLQKEQIDKLSGTALEETKRLTKLVEDLLLAAKVETAYQPVLETINIDDLIKDLLEPLRAKFPAFDFVYQAHQPIPDMKADKTGINSIVLNLLENAVKYSTGKGKIDIDLLAKNENLYLVIADDGIGITDKEKKKIFNRFYRIGNEDTRNTKGTGLGLYIVNEIVKAHEGKITVRDNVPRGTAFEVTLPINV